MNNQKSVRDLATYGLATSGIMALMFKCSSEGDDAKPDNTRIEQPADPQPNESTFEGPK